MLHVKDVVLSMGTCVRSSRMPVKFVSRTFESLSLSPVCFPRVPWPSKGALLQTFSLLIVTVAQTMASHLSDDVGIGVSRCKSDTGGLAGEFPPEACPSFAAGSNNDLGSTVDGVKCST